MLSLINLKTLRLHLCVKCEILPPQGKMPSLESLKIALMKVGTEFLGITETDEEDHGKGEVIPSKPSIILFPRLKELVFYDNYQWREWEGYCTTTSTTRNHHLTIIPCLHSLSISRGFSLEMIPEFLQMTPLQNLSIADSKILQQRCQKEVGKEWYKISYVPNIEPTCAERRRLDSERRNWS